MPDQPFSVREGLRPDRPLIFDDAPERLRYGIRGVLSAVGFSEPSEQRSILCQALRTAPDLSNFSEVPNIDNEVVELLMYEDWDRLFDAIERLPGFLGAYKSATFQEEMNNLFADEDIGYRFDGDTIVRVGTEEFEESVSAARTALAGERFTESRGQFNRALDFRNARPPDWANAIKQAAISVEGTLQIIYNRPGAPLTTIVSEDLPEDIPKNIRSLFRSLYGQGSGTAGARHASIGGTHPTAVRAELAIHVAAALHGFAVGELDST